jgi:hypothetical protein
VFKIRIAPGPGSWTFGGITYPAGGEYEVDDRFLEAARAAAPRGVEIVVKKKVVAGTKAEDKSFTPTGPQLTSADLARVGGTRRRRTGEVSVGSQVSEPSSVIEPEPEAAPEPESTEAGAERQGGETLE